MTDQELLDLEQEFNDLIDNSKDDEDFEGDINILDDDVIDDDIDSVMVDDEEPLTEELFNQIIENMGGEEEFNGQVDGLDDSTEEEVDEEDLEQEFRETYLFGTEIVELSENIIDALEEDEEDPTQLLRDAVEAQTITIREVAEAYGIAHNWKYVDEGILDKSFKFVNGIFDSVANMIFSLPGLKSMAKPTYKYPPRETRKTQMAIARLRGFVYGFIEDQNFWVWKESTRLLQSLKFYPDVIVLNEVLEFASTCKGWGEGFEKGAISIDQIFDSMKAAQEKAEEYKMKQIEQATKQVVKAK